MKKSLEDYRKGGVGALMDEYERAVREYEALLREISAEDYQRIADSETEDENCRSIQTVTSHVVSAGFGYANYIREYFSMPAEKYSRESVSYQKAHEKIAAMLDYTIKTLEDKWEMPDDEMTAVVIKARWGPTFDLEQMLEHAIVHILRHRRQIEKFLLKFRN